MLEPQEYLDYKVIREAVVCLDCQVKRVNLDEQPSLVRKEFQVTPEGLEQWDRKDWTVLLV